ncbi:hypothetical protein D6158_14925 [Nocardia seriolae]|nr:hypothetical protein D6158_14925 [Nocardia seriolae]
MRKGHGPNIIGRPPTSRHRPPVGPPPSGIAALPPLPGHPAIRNRCDTPESDRIGERGPTEPRRQPVPTVRTGT